MSCGGFLSSKLQQLEVQLLLAKARRLENEVKCWRLAKECLEAIKRIDEKFEPFKTCLDCEFRDRCTVWRKLRIEGVTEEAPIKCPYKQKGDVKDE